MSKWKYAVLRLEEILPGLTTTLSWCGVDGRKVVDFVFDLDDLGDHEWELVATFEQSQSVYFVFKRPWAVSDEWSDYPTRRTQPLKVP